MNETQQHAVKAAVEELNQRIAVINTKKQEVNAWLVQADADIAAMQQEITKLNETPTVSVSATVKK